MRSGPRSGSLQGVAGQSSSERPLWRLALRGGIVLLAIAAVGIALLLAASGRTALEAAGWTLVGLAAVLATAGAFYLVGLSEERDRGER